MAEHKGPNWEYETKCRRCGKFSKWHFSGKAQTPKVVWLNAMRTDTANPKQRFCETCDKRTVQDIVSYNEE